ncbi:MAG: LamG-like jellyroll fold domain-containing protein [Acidobacteriota bacterium]
MAARRHGDRGCNERVLRDGAHDGRRYGTVFSVVISNTVGSVTSSGALLTVDPAVDPALLAWWKLDDASGAVAADASGNGNAGALVNGPVWTAGFEGGAALRFDGAGTSVQVPDVPALNPSRITLAAWVNTDDPVSPQAIVAKDDGSACEYDLSIAGRSISFAIGGSILVATPMAGFSRSMFELQPFPDAMFPDTWYHIAATYDGATMRIYVDGVLSASQNVSLPATVDNGAPWVLGGRSSASAPWILDGRLDDVRIYDRALNAGEIWAVSGIAPDLEDVPYGPDPQQKIDLWTPSSSAPAPVVAYVHGGGFAIGDKRIFLPVAGCDLLGVMRELKECLYHGVAFASVNYRTINDSNDVSTEPTVQNIYPVPMLDTARAIQLLRYEAGTWNLDPGRVAAFGGSAGGGMSLWAGVKDDLADPSSSDPIARQSTRLQCFGGGAAQASYDPFWVEANTPTRMAISGGAFARLFGVLFGDLLNPTPQKLALYQDASMITFLDAADPPCWQNYETSPGATGSDPHHAMNGVKLKQQYDALGTECVLYTLDTPFPQRTETITDFFFRHFGMSPCDPLVVLAPAVLPDADAGVAYTQAVTASGGTGPYVFSLASGALPPGSTLAANGALTGVPSAAGLFAFRVSATGASSCAGSRDYVMATRPVDGYVVGEGLGQPNPNQVALYTASGKPAPVTFLAYAAGQFGVNVASANLDAQGYDEILTGPGPGPVFGPQVRAFTRAGSAMAKVNYYAYGTLRYGVNVTAAQVDGDAFDEIVSGAGPGAAFGPHVRGWSYDGVAISALAKINYFAYATLKFGVNAAAGNVDADGYDEILTGAGPGAVFGSTVRGWNYDGATITAIQKINFNAFAYPGFGVNGSAGDADGDSFDEIVATPGPGPSHPSRFLGFDYDGSVIAAIPGLDVTPFPTTYGGRVGARDMTADARAEILGGAGRDPASSSIVKAFSYAGALTQVPGPFEAFRSAAYGVNVTGGTYGY